MAHDVFISYSSKDKTVADATCAWLETHGIRCWVAPRDIRLGANWGASIVKAIRETRVMILIFSSYANSSPQIKREVERAVHAGATVIPMRIEDVLPQDDLEYFLGTPHWLDAFTPPLERHLEKLATAIQDILAMPAPVLPRETSQESTPDPTDVAAIPSGPDRPPASQPVAPKPKPPGRGWLIGLGVALAILILGAWGYYEEIKTPLDRSAPQESEGKAAAESEQKLTVSPAAAPSPPPPAPAAAGPVAGQPWTNSLGMKFVPAGTDGVLFSVWDVRVKDFQAFFAATSYDATGEMYSLSGDSWTQEGTTWKNPGFSQTEDDPVVGVNWNDALAFCQWLTRKDQAEGKLGSNQEYRLPTDAEWSAAVGLNESNAGTPAEKSAKVPGVYPWGTEWPPPKGAGNYCGEENSSIHPRWKVITGYNDGYIFTSPVGSFNANKYGLYDMGGNVWQWCEDNYNQSDGERTLRGGSWNPDGSDGVLSSFRDNEIPTRRYDCCGFRVVLVTGSAKP